jgi:penicillin-binding protein 1A
VYFDRSGLPNLESFIRFEPPTTGVVRDAHGAVLIELAREYRRIVTYDQVPPILRQAILAAEDKNFFSHSGVDYRALPRVVQKMTTRSTGEWWKGGRDFRLLLPQGGSTLTQQLVRTPGHDEPHRRGPSSAPPTACLLGPGSSATSSLSR